MPPVTVTMTESKGFDLKEEGEWYSGTLVDLEDLPDGQYGPGLKWIVNLDGDVYDDGKPRDTWAFCSQTLSPRSKLYKWAKGILGETAMPKPGETLDLGQLIGKRVKLMFEHVPGFDPDGNPITRERVVQIKAAGEAAPAAPAPAPTTATHVAPDAEPF